MRELEENEGKKSSVAMIVIIIIAVICVVMIIVPVLLAGVVFLWAQSFTEETPYDVTVLNIIVKIDSDAFSYADPVAAGVEVTVLRGTVQWDEYMVTITVGMDAITLFSAPLNSDLDPPLTFNAISETIVGGSVWFTQSTLTGLIIGMDYNVRFIDIDEQKVVWSSDVIARS